MFLKFAVEFSTSVIFFFVIVGTFLESGYCQLNDGEFNSCGGLSRLINSVFGGVDPNLKYMLFTRSNAQIACDLQPTEESFRMCNFNPKAKTAVIIHGWIAKLLKSSPVFSVKDKLLQVDNYNVVVFNWTAYSNTFNYTSSVDTNYDIAAIRSFYVGLKLSSLINFLQIHGGADTKYFHIISHSLGAEVTHFAAKTLCTNLGRITYLDAAAPFFRTKPLFLQPSSTDADIVESIHTNGALTDDEGNGYLRPIADIDYYPNGGQMQPKCVFGAKYRTVSGEFSTVTSKNKQNYCSHDLAFQYYIASFNKNCKFLGRICDSYKDFTAGKCSSAPVCRMGFYSKRLPNLSANSKCYLKTSAEPPYCLD